MSQGGKNGLTTVLIKVVQIQKNRKYEGTIQIGSFKIFYDIETIIPLDQIKEVELRKLKFETQKILFPTEVTCCKNSELIIMGKEEFVFFHNILYPIIKDFHKDPEIVRFNQMKEKKVKAWLVDRKGSLGRPLQRITIPLKISVFKIRNGDVPERIRMALAQA